MVCCGGGCCCSQPGIIQQCPPILREMYATITATLALAAYNIGYIINTVWSSFFFWSLLRLLINQDSVQLSKTPYILLISPICISAICQSEFSDLIKAVCFLFLPLISS